MTARTRAAAEADLQHLISSRRMRPIDALTQEQRRRLVWGEDYDAKKSRLAGQKQLINP